MVDDVFNLVFRVLVEPFRARLHSGCVDRGETGANLGYCSAKSVGRLSDGYLAECYG